MNKHFSEFMPIFLKHRKSTASNIGYNSESNGSSEFYNFKSYCIKIFLNNYVSRRLLRNVCILYSGQHGRYFCFYTKHPMSLIIFWRCRNIKFHHSTKKQKGVIVIQMYNLSGQVAKINLHQINWGVHMVYHKHFCATLR